jgi:hypothetical protein
MAGAEDGRGALPCGASGWGAGLRTDYGQPAVAGGFRYDGEMGPKLLGLVIAAFMALSLAGCNSNEDKYVVTTPIPPAPQTGQGTGH